MITTYSLLAKEIPTAKHDEQIPGANPSVEVRRGPCWGSRVGTASVWAEAGAGWRQRSILSFDRDPDALWGGLIFPNHNLIVYRILGR